MVSKKVRNAVIHTLEKVVSSDESVSLESDIYNLSETIDDNYQEIAYQKVGEVILKGKVSEKLTKDIKNRKIGLQSSHFNKHREKLLKLNSEKLEKPEVKEGEFQCKNKDCRSWKCFHTQSQTRSADEGATTFVTCTMCGQSYSFN